MPVKTVFIASTISGVLSSAGVYELLRASTNTPQTQYEEGDVQVTEEVKEEIPEPEDTNEEDRQAFLKDDSNEDNPESLSDAHKKETLREILIKKNADVVNENTPLETMGNILISRMFPSYNGSHEFQENQLFQGSPALKLKGKRYTDNHGKELFILEKNPDADLQSLQQACIEALNKEKVSDDEIYKLKEWCSVPTIKDVLSRHKFKFPRTDADWLAITKSPWIYELPFQSKQTLFNVDEFTTMIVQDDEEKIKVIKDKCAATLQKPFKRTNFPATKEFLSQTTEFEGTKKLVDEFQDAALLCTMPMTAGEYVEKAMKGTVKEGSVEHMKKDYCYVEGENNISYYKDIKTTDPMKGKSFWCAVRIVYRKSKEK